MEDATGLSKIGSAAAAGDPFASGAGGGAGDPFLGSDMGTGMGSGTGLGLGDMAGSVVGATGLPSSPGGNIANQAQASGDPTGAVAATQAINTGAPTPSTPGGGIGGAQSSIPRGLMMSAGPQPPSIGGGPEGGTVMVPPSGAPTVASPTPAAPAASFADRFSPAPMNPDVVQPTQEFGFTKNMIPGSVAPLGTLPTSDLTQFAAQTAPAGQGGGPMAGTAAPAPAAAPSEAVDQPTSTAPTGTDQPTPATGTGDSQTPALGKADKLPSADAQPFADRFRSDLGSIAEQMMKSGQGVPFPSTGTAAPAAPGVVPPAPPGYPSWLPAAATADVGPFPDFPSTGGPAAAAPAGGAAGGAADGGAAGGGAAAPAAGDPSKQYSTVPSEAAPGAPGQQGGQQNPMQQIMQLLHGLLGGASGLAGLAGLVRMLMGPPRYPPWPLPTGPGRPQLPTPQAPIPPSKTRAPEASGTTGPGAGGAGGAGGKGAGAGGGKAAPAPSSSAAPSAAAAPAGPDLSSQVRRGQANFMGSRRAAAMGINARPGQNLTNIRAPNGQSLRVNALAAPHFQSFLSELAGMGYKFQDVEGFANRRIGGTRAWSQHAYGNAIDINPRQNPTLQSRHNFPPNISQIAAKHGLIWGGDWPARYRDPMHFEWTGAGYKPQNGQRSELGNLAFMSPSTHMPLNTQRTFPEGAEPRPIPTQPPHPSFSPFAPRPIPPAPGTPPTMDPPDQDAFA